MHPTSAIVSPKILFGHLGTEVRPARFGKAYFAATTVVTQERRADVFVGVMGLSCMRSPRQPLAESQSANVQRCCIF